MKALQPLQPLQLYSLSFTAEAGRKLGLHPKSIASRAERLFYFGVRRSPSDYGLSMLSIEIRGMLSPPENRGS